MENQNVVSDDYLIFVAKYISFRHLCKNFIRFLRYYTCKWIPYVTFAARHLLRKLRLISYSYLISDKSRLS